MKVRTFTNLILENKSFPKAFINGLSPANVEIILNFIDTKLSDPKLITQIEAGGNTADLDWISDGLDISGDDLMHVIFELYGQKSGAEYGYDYTLNIDGKNFNTFVDLNGEWSDKYYCK